MSVFAGVSGGSLYIFSCSSTSSTSAPLWVRTDWTPSVYAIQNPVSRRGVKAAGILLPAVVPWSMARKAMGFVRTCSTKRFCGSSLLLPLSVLRQVLAVVFGLAKVFITGVFAEFEGASLHIFHHGCLCGVRGAVTRFIHISIVYNLRALLFMTEESVTQKGKARLSWPCPSSTSANVLAEVQQIQEALGVPVLQGLERIRRWAWRQAFEATIQCLCYAVASAGNYLVPINYSWGTATHLKEFMIVKLMVSLAVSGLRATDRCSSRASLWGSRVQSTHIFHHWRLRGVRGRSHSMSFAGVSDAFVVPDLQERQRIQGWAWRQANEATIQSLCYALTFAVDYPVPTNCSWGTANLIKEVMLVVLRVSLAVSRLHATYRRGQFPEWFSRITRCMAPGTFEELMIPGYLFEFLMRQVLQVKVYKKGGVVYICSGALAVGLLPHEGVHHGHRCGVQGCNHSISFLAGVFAEVKVAVTRFQSQVYQAAAQHILRVLLLHPPQAHRWWVRTDWTPSVYAIQNPVSRRGVKAAGILLPAVVPWPMARKAMGFVCTCSTKRVRGPNLHLLLLLPLSGLLHVLQYCLWLVSYPCSA